MYNYLFLTLRIKEEKHSNQFCIYFIADPSCVQLVA